MLQSDNVQRGDAYVMCEICSEIIKTEHVSYCKISGCVVLFIMSEHVWSPTTFLWTGVEVRSFVSCVSFCHIKRVCIKLCVNVREMAHVTVELFKIIFRFLQYFLY
jgi:hypothetical protein